MEITILFGRESTWKEIAILSRCPFSPEISWVQLLTQNTNSKAGEENVNIDGISQAPNPTRRGPQKSEYMSSLVLPRS